MRPEAIASGRSIFTNLKSKSIHGSPRPLAFLFGETMQAQVDQPNHKFSQQMIAVLLIFSADPYLIEATRPYVNLETQVIDWDRIFQIPFGSSSKAATMWAWACWSGQQPTQGDCFEMGLSMSSNLKVAVLEALCLRWGLRS